MITTRGPTEAAAFAKKLADKKYSFRAIGGARTNTKNPVSVHEQTYGIDLDGGSARIRIRGRTVFRPAIFRPNETCKPVVNILVDGEELEELVTQVDNAVIDASMTCAKGSLEAMLAAKNMSDIQLDKKTISEGAVSKGRVLPPIYRGIMKTYVGSSGDTVNMLPISIPRAGCNIVITSPDDDGKMKSKQANTSQCSIETEDDCAALNSDIPPGTEVIVDVYAMIRTYVIPSDKTPRVSITFYAGGIFPMHDKKVEDISTDTVANMWQEYSGNVTVKEEPDTEEGGDAKRMRTENYGSD